MRVTMQCGRQGSAVHNMHTHVARDSRDVMLYDYTHMPGATLRERELAYYRDTFGRALDARNERYRAQRHPERCRTMEQVYTGRTTRPEEVILQVGKMGETIDRETFAAVLRDFMRQYNAWNNRLGCPAQTLDVSIHCDETTPHAHWRRVWQYQDDYGHMQIGQEQALRRAGVQMPAPGAENRYNNRKITYDAQVRKLWQSVCRAHGLQIETEPLPSHRNHKSTEDYIDSCIADKVAQVADLDARIAAQAHNLQNLQDTAAQARRSAFEAREELAQIDTTLADKKRTLDRVERILDGAENVAAVVAPGFKNEIHRIRGEAIDTRDAIRQRSER